jgi:hypothetical protein
MSTFFSSIFMFLLLTFFFYIYDMKFVKTQKKVCLHYWISAPIHPAVCHLNKRSLTLRIYCPRTYCDLATTQDAAQSPWTQQGRSEVVARNPRTHKVADRRRLFWTRTKQSQKLCVLAESWLGRRGIAQTPHTDYLPWQNCNHCLHRRHNHDDESHMT